MSINLSTMATRSQRTMNNERDMAIIESEENSEVEVEENSEDEENSECYHNMIHHSIVSYLPESTPTLMRECWNISRIYLCWILVHMISVNLYCHFCAHISIYGFIMSPFVTVAPHCVALRWLTTNSINSISHMWTIIGAWLITKIPLTSAK